jgi:hypothetical protein
MFSRLRRTKAISTKNLEQYGVCTSKGEMRFLLEGGGEGGKEEHWDDGRVSIAIAQHLSWP